MDLTPDDLLAMPHGRCVALFVELPAPPLDELRGEIPARLLDQGAWWLDAPARAFVGGLPGRWLFKAFRPLSESAGEGYNGYRLLGRTRRLCRMRTSVGPSRLDGRPSFHLDYAPFRSPTGWVRMADELRRAGDGVYLGLGRMALTGGRLLPFVLGGVPGPWVGPDCPEW